MNRIISLITLFVMSAAMGWGQSVELLGAGATFPYPLYSKMFNAYTKETKVKVNYQGIGSGGGIQQLISKTVDFGGTDAPMNEKEEKAAKDEVLHFPTCLGAVVITYNLPGKPVLNFTADVIADIFLGKITKWNDPRIAEINKGTTLPDTPITVVRRSDGSGTTYTFSEYLTVANEGWKKALGTGKALNWPVGIGAKGNPGVAGYVKQVPGAIGYVELTYAKQNDMAYGRIKNKSGKFIEPTLESLAYAADVDMPAHTKVSLVDTAAPNGYPIATFTWIILYKEQGYGGRPKARTEALLDLLWWVIHDGQRFNETLDYGKLSPKAVALSEQIIKSVTHGGKNVR